VSGGPVSPYSKKSEVFAKVRKMTWRRFVHFGKMGFIIVGKTENFSPYEPKQSYRIFFERVW
jgi:hypothetical protein